MVLIDKATLTEFLRLSIKLSLEAGREILRVYEEEFTVNRKSDDSPLTIADISSHEIISAGLAVTGIPVLSEEGKDIPYEIRSKWEYLWLVDPLDGTKEFLKRNGEFTVNIALIADKKPVLGVIHAPAKKVIYYAIKGSGAYRSLINNKSRIETIPESQRLPINIKDNLSTLRIVASRSHLSSETEAYIKGLKENYKDISFFSAGSSLKFCLIAEGKADIYPRFSPTMEWDTAAGQIIVEEAGGEVLDAGTGRPLVYNKENLINPYFVVRRK